MRLYQCAFHGEVDNKIFSSYFEAESYAKKTKQKYDIFEVYLGDYSYCKYSKKEIKEYSIATKNHFMCIFNNIEMEVKNIREVSENIDCDYIASFCIAIEKNVNKLKEYANDNKPKKEKLGSLFD